MHLTSFELATYFIFAGFCPILIRCQTPSHRREQKECSLEEVERCTQGLQFFSENKDYSFPVTREELEVTCDRLRRSEKCLKERIDTCDLAYEEVIFFKDLIQPTQQLISQICNSSKVKKEFLRHAPCYRNVTARCANVHRETVLISSQAVNSPDVDSYLKVKLSCCALRQFVQCTRESVEFECGKEAESLMRQNLAKITDIITIRECLPDTLDDENCTFTLDELIESVETAVGSSKKQQQTWLTKLYRILFAR